MNPTSLLRVVVVLAMLGSHASAQKTEAEAEAPAKTEGSETKSKVIIEINGKRVEADDNGGSITIRTDGEEIEIDTDGDGKAEKRIEKDAPGSKTAWLGVKNTDVRAELASQLDIEGGALIEMVVPDSPADLAGLQEYDIITAVGETEISAPEDLSMAIRALKPGSKVGISILRKAKPVELTATLGDRPKMPKGMHPGFHDLQLNGNADEIRARLEQIQKEMLNGMKLRIDGANLPDIGNGEDIVQMSSKMTSFSDGNGSITITTKDGKTHIQAKDADGKLLYKGPAETEDDRKKLPPEVLEKLKRFEEMNVDIDVRGFEDKMLPPALDLPKLKPAKKKKQKQATTETRRISAS